MTIMLKENVLYAATCRVIPFQAGKRGIPIIIARSGGASITVIVMV
jgi:hypothetical protein